MEERWETDCGSMVRTEFPSTVCLICVEVGIPYHITDRNLKSAYFGSRKLTNFRLYRQNYCAVALNDSCHFRDWEVSLVKQLHCWSSEELRLDCFQTVTVSSYQSTHRYAIAESLYTIDMKLRLRSENDQATEYQIAIHITYYFMEKIHHLFMLKL